MKKIQRRFIRIMDANNTFIDIERFAKWAHNNPKCFYGKDEPSNPNKYTETTRINWETYKKMPIKTLEDINLNYLNGEKKFETINIPDFILCANMSKDHNRGNSGCENKPLSSTGKKVLMMLLLARNIGDNIEDSPVTVKQSFSDPLYKYLSRNGDHHNIYYYFPGRTVSFLQLNKLAERYKNKITSSGIKIGLQELIDRDLVKMVIDKKLCITKMNELFKLDFDGCYKFINENKSNK